MYFYFLALADAYFQSPWEDVALEVTVSSEKSYRCELQCTFSLIGHAIAMIS